MQCFNHHGKVSYWLFPTGYEDINKARLELIISGIKRTLTDENGKIVSERSIDDNTFEMHWKNVYNTHVRTFDLNENVKCKLDENDRDGDRLVDCKLTKVKVTPVTLYFGGAHGRFSAYMTLVGYNEFTEREESINGNEMKSIFVGDMEIRLENEQISSYL